jgi:hypothetical protein
MNICKYLILFISFTVSVYAQPVSSISCGRDTCSSDFVPENSFDKIFHSSFDLGNNNQDNYVIVRTTNGEIPRSLRIYMDSSDLYFPASIDIKLQATTNQNNSADSILIGDLFKDVTMNLDGYSPTVGRSSSQVCADYTKRGIYGELAKLEFETARLLSQSQGGNLPEDRCVFSDVQNIQKNAFNVFQCGGDQDYNVLNTNDPSVTARRLRGKNKCLGVAFQDICLSPMIEITCNWRLKYSSTQSPVENALIYGTDRAELESALSQYIPPSTDQIFSTWTRFDGGSYFHPAGTSPYGYSQAGAWIYNSTFVRDTVNSSNFIGFVSAQNFDEYEHEATLSSPNSDDDSIGIIIAFTRINNKNHYLIVSRDKGGNFGASNNWNLVYVDGSSSTEGASNVNAGERKVLQSKLIGSNSGGWSGSTSKVKVKREGDLVQAWTSEFNSVSYPNSSLFQINLNDYPELYKFKGKKSYGYTALSQDGATFSEISFKGGLQTARIIDAVEDKVYVYNPVTASYEVMDSSAIIQGIENASGSLGDVIIASGESVNLISGNTYIYDSLNIEEGGVLNLEDGSIALTKIIIKNNFINNGLINGSGNGDFVGDNYSENNSLMNKVYSFTVGQPSGGSGGNQDTGYIGGISSDGNGGGGSQGDVPCLNLSGQNGNEATLLVAGESIPTNNNAGSCGIGSGASGKGGQRAKHGQSMLFVVLGNIEGEGSINLSGNDGENGFSGQPSGQGGSGGGGGAGGSGGNLFLEYGGELSEELEIVLNGGSSGKGGLGGISSGSVSNGQSGNDGEFGFAGRLVSSKLNSNIPSLYGTEREIINFINGKRYWINADGSIEDSQVGEYSTYESESESKKFQMLESEYLDKKEKGLLKYMCNNLTYDLNEEIEEETNLITNSNFTQDSSSWDLEGKSQWSFEKIKVNANPLAPNLVIGDGEHITFSNCSQRYFFQNVTIEAGGSLTFKPKENCIYQMEIQNKLILNGTIIAKGSTFKSSNSFYDFALEENNNYDMSLKQPFFNSSVQGSTRDFGCANADYFSGENFNLIACDGKKSGRCKRFCYKGQCQNSRNAAGIFNGFLKQSNQVYTGFDRITRDLRKGCGGKFVYGVRINYRETNAYTNGVPFFIHSPIIEGTGSIDGRPTEHGTGAKVFLRYDYLISDNLNYLIESPSGSNGFIDIKKTTLTPDLSNLTDVPSANQIIPTEIGKKYRVTGVFSQSVEDNIGSAGQVNVYSDIPKLNKIYQQDITPAGFINPAWLDSVPTYKHFGRIGVGGSVTFDYGYIQGSTTDFGCNDADYFSSALFNTLTCDGSKSGRCSRWCYKGTCSNNPKALFDNHIRTSSDQQYTSEKRTTGDLRGGCRGKFVYGVQITYKQINTSFQPFNDFRIVNREENRPAVNCEEPFIGSDTGSTSEVLSPHFQLEVNSCPDELAAGEDCFVTVKANPQAGGTFTGYLKMICDDPNFGRKSTMITEVQVTTSGTPKPKDEPIRSIYPVENKPILVDENGESPEAYLYFKSCSDLQKNGNIIESGKYFIDPDGQNGPIDPFQVYCDMTSDGGGWTLVSRLATNTDVWSYNSPYWTNDSIYNEKDLDLTTNKNMKSRAYTSIEAKETRICMINTENCMNLVTNKENAKEVFGTSSDISFGRYDIMNLTQQNYSNFENQPFCNSKGFNNIVSGNWKVSCRFGLIMNDNNNCTTPDSFIGLGCYHQASNSNVSVGSLRSNPTRESVYRGWVWVRDDVEQGDTKITARKREPIDFVFQAQSSSSILELRSFQREYPSYYDNIKVQVVPSNAGPTLPPAQEGLANVIGQDGPGFYDIYGEPEISRTAPTYNPEDFTSPDESLWGLQYVKVGQQCPIYHEKIEEDYVTTHIAFDPDDDRCDNIDYKYDPENRLIDWKNVGFERKAEFGVESVICSIGDCSIKSNVENINATMTPNISLDDDLRGTQQGEGIMFIYDAENIVASATKGSNATKGVNDLPTINEVRYCYKIQDANTEGSDSPFASDPVVQFRKYNWQAIKVETTGAQPQPIEDNGKKINIFKKVDSSVRNFLKEELL